MSVMGTIRYATLAQARAEIKQEIGKDVGGDNDAYVFESLRFVSSRIDQIKAMTFAPHIGIQYLDGRGWHIDALYRSIDLPEPFLKVTGVTVGGVVWVSETDFVPNPKNRTPIYGLRIPGWAGKSWTAGDDWIDSIAITGIRGWHRDYANAWIASGDSVQNAGGISASATSITVADAARFSPGQLCKIGTVDDWRELTAINTTTDVLTVRTHARGSTSVVQAQGAAISVYQADPVIQRAALRWAGYLYKRRGAFNTVQVELDAVAGRTLTDFPPDAPQEVTNILDEIAVWQPIEGV